MDHCCWSLSNSFLEVSFHAQVDRARAIPIPSAHQPITGSSANEEEGRLVSCPKRRKLGHWAEVKSAVLWLDRHLVHRPPGVEVPLVSWIQAFKSIGQNACNLESCCILSEGGSLPASAIAALLREVPELKKLQVRNLLLEGTHQDLLDLQHVLQHQCASLKDFFYNGPVTNVQSNSRRRQRASNNNNHSPLQVADAHILAKPNLKRLSMIGLPVRGDEKKTKIATSFYSSLRQCPDLEMLRLDVDPNALKMIAQIVANCPRLRRLSLGIQRTNKQHKDAPPNKEEVQAFSQLTHALMKSKVLHLELCVDSALICSTRIQNLWMDLFRQNYSCKCFSVKIFDNDKNKGQAMELPDLHPARGWYSEVQRLVDLNAHKRLPVLSSFAYDISSINSWIDLLQELSTPPPSKKKKKKKDETTLDQEDILTGIYLFLHDHSETLCKVALNRQTIVTRSRRPEGLSEAGTRVWLACMHGFKSTAVEVQSELVPRLTRELGDQCHVQAKLVHLFLSLEKREHELNEFWDFFSETKQKNASDWTALDMRRWRLTRWLDRFSMATLHWLAKMISGGILGHMKSMDSLSDTWKSHEENETALTNSIVRVHDVMTRVGMHF